MFDDDLSDLLGAPMRPQAPQPPENYRPPVFEPCKKCNGKGRFISYAGRDCGPCFTCKGKGRFEFKTDADTRARNRANAQRRKATSEAERVCDFQRDNPEVWGWINAQREGFEFAASLRNAIAKYGDLTDGQREAVARLMARDAQRKADDAARVANAPAVDAAGVDRLKVAFDTAKAKAAARGRGVIGLRTKNPRLTIGDFYISPAKETSANPGALYVKTTGRVYLGKINGDKFFAARECPADVIPQVQAFIADPMAAAEAYGKEFKRCCICNATLTNEESMQRGIGPICAANFGW
jgi:Family of unknown function (DUF6011)